MLKTTATKKLVKKTSVFVSVFAATGVVMGSALMGFSESDIAQATFVPHYDDDILFAEELPDGESYDDFVTLVQAANKTDGGQFIPAEQTPKGLLTDVEATEDELAQEEEIAVDGFVYVPEIPLNAELQEFTYNRCEELGLEYELVLAIMWRESRFQTNAVGYNTNGTRDSGIMQINDVNRTWLRNEHGITDLMDPYQNITAGTIMLADYMDELGDENAVLMAYHYGKAGMQQKFAQGITTNRQVQIALSQRDLYREMVANV